ncbi:MAG: YbaB/EbfC family nucleoid-associated protein [Solirubrobacterales bacterium]
MARKGMGGMGGGMDMQALLKQAQQMQTDMVQAQEALKDEEVEASAGGGMVKVKITGDLVIKDVKIDPDAVDPEDVDMLADMVQAAVNEAIRSAQELAASKMPDMPGMPGMGGPGLPGG